MNTEAMQAAVFRGPGNIQLEERPIPTVKPGTVLLKVKSCAVCGSDLRIFKNGNERVAPPRIIGHEMSGEIVEVGEGVTNFKKGDRVSVGADVPCGECIQCVNGRANCCDTNLAMGYQFDGGFAQYVLLDPLVVSIGPLKKFGNDLSFDEAALAEPLACCINGYERAMISQFEGGTVAIFGTGPIGILLGLLAPHFKFKQVILIDPSDRRLQIAKEITGAAHTINPTTSDPVAEVMKLTSGKGADIVFTACPAVESHEQAVEMVAKRGVVNLFGGLAKTARKIEILSNMLHYREAYLTGSHGSTPAQHARALELIETRKINVKPLLSHSYALSKIQEGLQFASSAEGLKVVIKPNG